MLSRWYRSEVMVWPRSLMVGMLPFGVGQWQSSARRGTVPGYTGVYHGTNEHRTNIQSSKFLYIVVLTIYARVATAAPLPGSWCVHNTARRAAADHGSSGAFPGVEDPGIGYGRVSQRALK